MKRKTFAILFYVKRTKLLKNGEAPIFMRITVDSVIEELAVKRSIKLEHWESNKGRAKPVNVAKRNRTQSRRTKILQENAQVSQCNIH